MHKAIASCTTSILQGRFNPVQNHWTRQNYLVNASRVEDGRQEAPVLRLHATSPKGLGADHE